MTENRRDILSGAAEAFCLVFRTNGNERSHDRRLVNKFLLIQRIPWRGRLIIPGAVRHSRLIRAKGFCVKGKLFISSAVRNYGGNAGTVKASCKNRKTRATKSPVYGIISLEVSPTSKYRYYILRFAFQKTSIYRSRTRYAVGYATK